MQYLEVDSMTDEKIVSKQVIEVEDNTMYEFSLISWHYGEFTNKGMVFYVKFFDDKNKEINNRIFRFSSSRAFTNYMYVSTGTKSDPVYKTVSIMTPGKTQKMEVGLVMWGFLDSPEGKILLNENPTSKTIDTSEGDSSTLIQISDKWIYSANLKIEVPDNQIGRVAILGVKYFDNRNRELRPTKKEHVFWSSDLGTYYRYISSQNGGKHFTMEHVFYPPEKAIMMESTIMNWKGTNCKITIQGPLKSNLNWTHSDKSGLLKEVELLDSQNYSTYNKKAETVANSSREKQLEMNYESFIHSGDLLSARDSASSLFSLEQSKSNQHRVNHINSLIKSLDVNWFPEIHSSNQLINKANKNKIMHLFKVSYPFESTGGSIRNLNIVSSQKNAGIDPFVVTPLNYPRIFNIDDFSLEEEIEKVRHIRLDLGSRKSSHLTYITKNLQLNTLLLAGIVRQEAPEIIHAASGYKGYELATMADTLSRHFSIPWIYEVRSFHEHTWTNDHFQAETSIHTKLRMDKENSLMNRATHVVTISDSMKDAIIERGIPEEKITVVPNAVDTDYFKPMKKNSKLINSLGLKNKTVLGYISNMSYREGHDVLIRAFKIISKQVDDSILLLVGNGREKETLESLVKQLNLEDKVIFTGNVDHSLIKDYYALIDLFVVPRRRDYAADLVTPLKPYEAMGMKIPLLMSDRAALKEILGEDRGFIFKTEDEEDLANVAINCLNDKNECSRRANIAHQWLIENRTWDMNAEIYKQLYNDIIGR